MIAQELKDFFRETLVAQRTIAQEFAALDALVDFVSQNDHTSIPDWTSGLTFQLDGSDDGAFCTEPDTNGRIRFFKTKVNNNTGNSPPTDPLITENTYWIEVSPSDGSSVKEWAVGVYGSGLVIVYFDTSGTGADPDLYVLAEPTRPFNSTNFTTELAAGKWKRMQTVFDVAGTGGTDVMNIGTTNADVINIGRVGATVNIYGNTIYSQVTNLEVSDKLIRLNRGGAAASAGGSGFELEENSVITGYIKTSSDRNGYELKAPNQSGIVTLEFNASGDLIIKPAGTTKLTVSSTGAAVAGNVSNTGALFFSGAVSPAQITGNQNDYSPTDFHNYANVRLSSDASRDITGFGAPVAGEFKVVHNVGSFDIVFKNANAGSAAANRFALNADLTLKSDHSTIFWYDSVSSRWRGVQPGGGSAGGWLLASGGTLTGNNTITMGANTVTFSGNKVLFTSSSTIPAINIGSFAGNPSGATNNGDVWYNSSTSALYFYSAGSLRVFADVGGIATNQIPRQTGTGILSGTTQFTYFTATGGANSGLQVGNRIAITQPAAASTWASALSVTPGAHTSMTAATAFVSNDFVGASQQWLAGTVTSQIFNYFRGFTVTGASATATFSKAYTVYIDPSTVGANAAITENVALGLGGTLATRIIWVGTSSTTGASSTQLLETASGNFSIQAFPAGASNTIFFDSRNGSFTTGNYVGVRMATAVSPTSGTQTYKALQLNSVINQTGGANGQITLVSIEPTYTATVNATGLDYNPTVTSITGTHLAIRTTSGQIFFANASGDSVTASTRMDIRGVSSGNIVRGASNSNSEIFTITNDGLYTWKQANVNATSGIMMEFRPGSHTNLPASTESYDFLFTLSRTVTWATGGIALQRSVRFGGPTWAFNGASTVTDGYTMFIDAPTAGSNATITRKYALGLSDALGIDIGTTVGSVKSNSISISARDSSDGAANSTLALYLEQAVEAIGTFTPSHKLKLWINGTEYWIQLDAV